MKGIDHAVSIELNIYFDVIASNCFIAHGTRRSASRSVEPDAIRSTKRQTPTLDDISRLVSELRLVRHHGWSITPSCSLHR
jgi:hypothetical protein